MTWSQYGEDDIIDTLISEEGLVTDIGAGDGMEISNSRLFRERGWLTCLIEPDPRHAESLAELAKLPNVHVKTEAATPENVNDLVATYTGILSIDVDGDDIFLLEALDCRPQVIVVEHNPTIPYRLDVQPRHVGLQIGSSVAALCRVAEAKGYGLRSVTMCNAIFQYGVRSMNIPPYRPAYAVATEYFTGRPLVLGEAPWGVDFSEPFPGQDVVIR